MADSEYGAYLQCFCKQETANGKATDETYTVSSTGDDKKDKV